MKEQGVTAEDAARDAEVHGMTAEDAARDAEVHGMTAEDAARDAEVRGMTAEEAARDAEVRPSHDQSTPAGLMDTDSFIRWPGITRLAKCQLGFV